MDSTLDINSITPETVLGAIKAAEAAGQNSALYWFVCENLLNHEMNLTICMRINECLEILMGTPAAVLRTHLIRHVQGKRPTCRTTYYLTQQGEQIFRAVFEIQ